MNYVLLFIWFLLAAWFFVGAKKIIEENPQDFEPKTWLTSDWFLSIMAFIVGPIFILLALIAGSPKGKDE